MHTALRAILVWWLWFAGIIAITGMIGFQLYEQRQFLPLRLASLNLVWPGDRSSSPTTLWRVYLIASCLPVIVS